MLFFNWLLYFDLPGHNFESWACRRMHPRQNACPQLSKLIASIIYPWHNGQANAADMSPIFTDKDSKSRTYVTEYFYNHRILNLCLNDNLLRLVHLLVSNLGPIMIAVMLVMSMMVNVPFQFRCSILTKMNESICFLELKRKMGINPFEGM